MFLKKGFSMTVVQWVILLVFLAIVAYWLSTGFSDTASLSLDRMFG